MREKLSSKIENMPSEITIDFRKVIAGVVRKLWVAVLIAALTAGAGYGIASNLVTPLYKSTTQVYVISSSNDAITYSDLQVATQLSEDYAQIVISRGVLEEVIENLVLSYSYSELKENVTVSSPTSGRILEIAVLDADPKLAQTIANEIRDVATEQLKTVTNIETITVIDYANLPAAPASPNIRTWTLRGALYGGCAAILLIAIREFCKEIFAGYTINDEEKTTKFEKSLHINKKSEYQAQEGM